MFNLNKGKDKSDGKVQLISNDAPFQFVEAYKSLRTNLSFVSVNNQYHKIVVTSSIPGEGKSTVSINLSIALADSGNRVLLIDTDLRKPVMQKYLRIPKNLKAGGLTSVLAGIKPLDQCIIHFTDICIDVITSGPIPPNPAELLSSKKMEEVVSSLEKQYDYIIFDTPPVSVVTDAAALTKITDGVIFVVRHNSTPIETAQFAKRNLENVKANIIGCVLNIFNADKSNSYTYYHSKDYNYEYK